MAKKESVLKWCKEDEKNLRKAVSDFNKKVKKLKKTRKDVLWKVEVTVKNEVAEELHNRMADVPHSYIEVGKNTLFNFYCDTQKESAKVKEVVKHYNAKYFVAESKAL